MASVFLKINFIFLCKSLKHTTCEKSIVNSHNSCSLLLKQIEFGFLNFFVFMVPKFSSKLLCKLPIIQVPYKLNPKRHKNNPIIPFFTIYLENRKNIWRLKSKCNTINLSKRVKWLKKMHLTCVHHIICYLNL